MKKKSKSVIRLKYIELIAFVETWLAGLCFVVGIKWLIGLSIALFAIPLWGLISHRRWCRAHNEPYANWELFYTVIAWIVYIFITLVIYFHFFTWSYTEYSVMLQDTVGEWLLPNTLRLPRFSTPPSLRDTSPIFCMAKHPRKATGHGREEVLNTTPMMSFQSLAILRKEYEISSNATIQQGEKIKMVILISAQG